MTKAQTIVTPGLEIVLGARHVQAVTLGAVNLGQHAVKKIVLAVVHRVLLVGTLGAESGLVVQTLTLLDLLVGSGRR